MVSILRDSASRRAGAIVIALALLSSAFYYASVRGEQNRAECQSRYNEAFSRSLTIRSKFSTDRQNAVDDVILGVGRIIIDPPSTPADQKKSAADYVRLFTDFDAVSKANEAARSANPLPELPSC